MKKRRDKAELNLPISHQPFPESRELSMDDYYEFVVSNLVLFGKPPLESRGCSERFVIREDDEPCFGAKPKT